MDVYIHDVSWTLLKRNAFEHDPFRSDPLFIIVLTPFFLPETFEDTIMHLVYWTYLCRKGEYKIPLYKSRHDGK